MITGGLAMKITSKNYLVIQGWMVTELNLKGNELLVYAIIYGFSQVEGQLFFGNRQYLVDWTNTSKQTIQTCLNSLVKKKMIVKYDKDVNGVHFCEYEAIREIANHSSEVENNSETVVNDFPPILNLSDKENEVEEGGSQISLLGVKKFDRGSKTANKPQKINKSDRKKEKLDETTIAGQTSLPLVKKIDGGSKKLTGVVKKIDGGSQKICPIDNITINNNIYNSSIHPSCLDSSDLAIEEREAYKELIKENIEFEYLVDSLDTREQAILEEIIEIMTDTVSVKRASIKIAQTEHAFNLVKSKLMKLNREHMMYVLYCFSQNHTKIHNVRSYLLTSLYNAPDTIKSYYSALVSNDMYEGRV